MRPETLKGHLDGMLLAALEPGPRHGYAIMEAAAPRLRADPGRVACPRRRAGHLAAVLRRRHRPAGTRAPAGDPMTPPARLGRAHAGAEVVPPGHAGQLVDSYLAEVAARLPCPARARGGIIADLRAGLLDATDAYHDGGLPAGSAAAAAVAEFGDPRRVAGAFRPGLIGLLWAATAVASHIGIRHPPPWQEAGAPPGSLVAFPLAAAACVIAVWGALFTIAATGRGPPLASGACAPGPRPRGNRRPRRRRRRRPGPAGAARQPDPPVPRRTYCPPLPRRPYRTRLMSAIPAEPDRQAVREEMERSRQTFHRLLDHATVADLRRPSNGTRWTNEQLLFHMLLGYLIVRALLVLARIFGRLPDGASRAVARLLGPALRRGMHSPPSWDPFFTGYMTLYDLYRYPTKHFDFHSRQLTLQHPA